MKKGGRNPPPFRAPGRCLAGASAPDQNVTVASLEHVDVPASHTW